MRCEYCGAEIKREYSDEQLVDINEKLKAITDAITLLSDDVKRLNYYIHASQPLLNGTTSYGDWETT